MKEGFFILLAPFLPEQMHNKNVSQAFFTPLFLQTIFQLNNYFKVNIQYGCLSGLCLVEGFKVTLADEKWPYFLAVGFLGRAVQGTGAGFYQTAAYSELLIQFPQIQKKLVSMMEVGAVMGGSSGLVISAILSYLIGFMGPFLFVGFTCLMFLIFQDKLISFADQQSDLTSTYQFESQNLSNNLGSLNSSLLREMSLQHNKSNNLNKPSLVEDDSDKSQYILEQDSSEEESHQENNQFDNKSLGLPDHNQINNNQVKALLQLPKRNFFDKVTYSDIILTKRGFFACLTVIVNIQTFYYNDTILAEHLQSVYGFSPSIISLVYAIQQVGFMTTAPISPNIVHKFSLVGVVVVTQVIQGSAALLIGPSEMLGLSQKIYVTMIGLAIAGLASPFSIIAPYSEMEQCLSIHKTKRFNPHEVADMVSAIFNSSYALGSIAGPLFGGYVNEWTNFRRTNDIQALLLFSVAFLQFVVVYIPQRLDQFVNNITNDESDDNGNLKTLDKVNRNKLNQNYDEKELIKFNNKFHQEKEMKGQEMV
ncbi:permeases of the major facilitator superfamily [Stylonychia lemnae]|uniref:Permeases of the major facilitator superfamily n=1 Tax=Stylonychia lemnae TaxID=5949 RepID=A0A078A7B9_STYLE|nr:permeases of the major facilitator superfamily [Stylonychia lemnae]|eukprot:CDW77432.1 permeases of the major facilitator superfamily [Stylonychia lemnae]